MDWPSPPGSPCAPPSSWHGGSPSLSLVPKSLESAQALSLPSLSCSPLCFAHPSSDALLCFARPSADAPLPSACFPSLAAQRSALQLPPSPSRSSWRWQNRVGDGRIELVSNRIDEKTAELSVPASKSTNRQGVNCAYGDKAPPYP
jgi:hypothetical protein